MHKFLKAAQNGKLDEVKRYIEIDGIDVNLTSENSQISALYLASLNGYDEVVDYLLKKGANVHQKTSNTHLTPLYVAAMRGRINVIVMLVNYGADVNDPSSDGKTPLAIAEKCGHKEVCKLLASHGAKRELHLASENVESVSENKTGNIKYFR